MKFASPGTFAKFESYIDHRSSSDSEDGFKLKGFYGFLTAKVDIGETCDRLLRCLKSRPPDPARIAVSRRVFSGEFMQVNRHLLYDLISRVLSSDEMRVKLIANNSSVQGIDLVLDLAADRGAYINQSQSLNTHMVNATTAKL